MWWACALGVPGVVSDSVEAGDAQPFGPGARRSCDHAPSRVNTARHTVVGKGLQRDIPPRVTKLFTRRRQLDGSALLSVMSASRRDPDGWGSLKLATLRLTRLAQLPLAEFQLCTQGVLAPADLRLGGGTNVSVCCDARCSDGCFQCRKATAARRFDTPELARHHCCPGALLNRSLVCRGENDIGCFAHTKHAVPPPNIGATALPAGLLRHALPESSYAHNAGLARFFRRLRGGLPVRALALGSSVTATAAGCSASLVPYCPRCCGVQAGLPRGYWASRRGDGFLRIAWDWLNTTWPHPSHQLYNAGRPGAGIDHFIGCLGAWVPDDVDLFVVETGATGVEHARLETLLRQLLGLRPFGHTAIVAFSLFNYRLSIPELRTRGFSPPPDEELFTLVSHYGGSMLSEWGAFFHEFVDSPADGGVHLAPADVKKSDGVHLSGGGANAWGQIFTEFLRRADASHEKAPLGSGSNGGLAALPPPLFNDSHSAYRGTRDVACYSFDRGRLGGTSALHERALVDSAGGMPPFVLQNDGWSFVFHEPRSNSTFKPGLLARYAGAVLRVRILPADVDVAGAPHARQPLEPRARYIVALHHLISYEHQGRALVTCVEDCACQPQTIEGHRSSPRVSVLREHRFEVQMHAAWRDRDASATCALRVEVLQTSLSGEHEFKLARLVISEQLRQQA